MYSEEHRLEKQREATRRYREQHPEHKDKAAARYLEKKAADPDFAEKQREKTRKWRASHTEANKEIQKRQDTKRYHGTKAEAFALLGNRCAMEHVLNDPLATDPRSLQIDHIEAIGDAQRRKLNHRGRILYREVIAHPKKYQLLCASHNWIKRHENNECNNRSDTRNTTTALG